MEPRLNACFLGPTWFHFQNSIWISSAVFTQLMKEVPVLYFKSAPSNTWFLGTTQVHNPNGILICSVDFCRVHDIDRPTDRQTGHTTPSVTIGHIYIVLRCGLKKMILLTYEVKLFFTIIKHYTSGYTTWFTAGGAICIAHYDVIDDVITWKL